MNQRLCGYQVRIKINAFWLRRLMPLPLAGPLASPAAFLALPAPEALQHQGKPDGSKIFSAHAPACIAEAKQILERNLSHHYSVK